MSTLITSLFGYPGCSGFPSLNIVRTLYAFYTKLVRGERERVVCFELRHSELMGYNPFSITQHMKLSC